MFHDRQLIGLVSNVIEDAIHQPRGDQKANREVILSMYSIEEIIDLGTRRYRIAKFFKCIVLVNIVFALLGQLSYTA
jgi:hypothetical protein